MVVWAIFEVWGFRKLYKNIQGHPLNYSTTQLIPSVTIRRSNCKALLFIATKSAGILVSSTLWIDSARVSQSHGSCLP